jgi:hypothetical protein
VSRLPARPGGRLAQRRRRRRQRRLVLAAVSAVSLLAGTGVAYAFWSSTGVGSATIGATTAAPLTVTAVASPLTDLYPGKTDDLGIRIANSNAYAVSLTRLTAATVTSSDASACPTSNVVLPAAVTTALAGGGWTLPAPVAVSAGASGTAATLAGFVTLAASAPDGCQGKTFTIALTVTGSQV